MSSKGLIFVSDDYGSTWSLSMSGYDQAYSQTNFVNGGNGDIYLASEIYANSIKGT